MSVRGHIIEANPNRTRGIATIKMDYALLVVINPNIQLCDYRHHLPLSYSNDPEQMT